MAAPWAADAATGSLEPMITNATTHSAAELRSHLDGLLLERAAARSAGLDRNAAYMDDLVGEIDEVERAYVTLAVTEIATLRGELGDARYG
jgi:hypothetical protein